MSLPLDDELTAPTLPGNPNAWHEIYAKMRRDDPLHYSQPTGFRPYWLVTKTADIQEIEANHEIFINAPRIVLSPIETETMSGDMLGENAQVRTLVNMDGIDHKNYRRLTQDWFTTANVRKLADGIRELAHESFDTMLERGNSCDFQKEVAVWLPLRVILLILGIPRTDEARMLRLTQELLGGEDPELMRKGSDAPGMDVLMDMFQFFGAITEDRRANPRDDLASLISNGTINGEPIGHIEAMSYYVIISTAGHDTTSFSMGGGLLALIENPEQFAKLRSDPAKYLDGTIAEILRWVSPVRHFMRTAKAPYTLRGKQINEGDSVFLSYWSANRDEDVFEDPMSFRIDRPNGRNIAFGWGAHNCLGQHLARLELRIFLEVLLQRVESIELAGEPQFVESHFVSGPKSLPVRYKIKPRAE
jgi:cytochrome P450